MGSTGDVEKMPIPIQYIGAGSEFLRFREDSGDADASGPPTTLQ